MKPNKEIALLIVIFFLTMIISDIIYYNRESPYLRPPQYFYLLSVAVGVIVIQIIRARLKRFMELIIFIEIFMVLSSFTLTQQALYKTPLSRDPWTHGALIAQIIKTSHIPPYQVIKTPYVWLPNFHLTIVSIMQTSGLPYKWAAYVLAVSSFILALIISYIFFTWLWDSKRLTMLALLLIGVSDNVLSMIGVNIIPNSIGVILAFLIFWILLRNENKTVRDYTVLVILFFSLAFMHTLSYGFVITELLFVILVLITLHRKHPITKLLTALFAISWIIALFVWGLLTEFYLRSLTMLIKGLFVGFEIVETYTQRIPIPLETIVLSRIGMLIYFGLVGLGILTLLFKSEKNIRLILFKDWKILSKLSYSSVSLWTAMMSFSFLLPSWAGIAHRFWYYGEILGSIFIAKFFKTTWERSRSTNVWVGLTVISLMLISLLMFTAQVSNDDNPMIKEYSTRTGWYDSELRAGIFTLNYATDRYIASDWDYLMNLNNLRWTTIRSLPSTTRKYGDIGWVIKPKFPKSLDDIAEDREYIFIFRKSLTENYAFWLGPRWGMNMYPPLGNNVYAVLEKLNSQRNIVYNTKTVVIWS